MNSNFIFYVLQLADNALIQGHRISEWCGHGPILEQDIALINTALDHLGQARNFYQYAADLINALPQNEKSSLFRSPSLNQKLASGENITEDDLAYLRDSWDYKNVLLVEQPNEDWAYTVVRSFFYDHFNFLLYSQMKDCPDQRLAAIAEKSLKETKYHRKWSSEWIIRLGDGTDESHRRVSEALESRWSYTGELFAPSEAEQWANSQLGMPDVAGLRIEWLKEINEVINEATLITPDPEAYMHLGGKKGVHSEHLGYILAELQFVQRAYPGMQW